MAETATYRVQGMTCDHCVQAVAEEVSGVPGVTSVDVDLDSGHLRVTAEPAPDEEAVREAVAEAGYVLVSS